MSLTRVHLAEEALALSPAQRETPANDSSADAETKSMLRARLEDLKTGRDKGMSFEEVFGEALS